MPELSFGGSDFKSKHFAYTHATDHCQREYKFTHCDELQILNCIIYKYLSSSEQKSAKVVIYPVARNKSFFIYFNFS